MEMFLGDKGGKEFASYLAEHGKSYATKKEYEMRREIFERSLSAIMLQDDSITWERGLNKFSDLTEQEFKGYLGARHFEQEGSLNESTLSLSRGNPVPVVTYNWTSYMNPVRNQNAYTNCGSCWAFATVAVLEGRYAVKYSGTKIQLSEQMLLDCVRGNGKNSDGCNGGIITDGFDAVMKNGIIFASSYPYTGIDEKCKVNTLTKSDLSPVKIATIKRDLNPRTAL